ncbi:MAG: SIMPL domain-containing protein [Planctomycetes bacterium]|nr:SIMPL domain-containing protein [Planctomycetota bacterium]
MKNPKTYVVVVGTLGAIILAVGVAARLPGQGGGSRAGVYPPPTAAGQSGASTAGSLDHEAVENYITIVGRAEIRVQPMAVRVIMAVTSEGKTAEECMKANGEKEKALTDALAKLGIKGDKVFMDFISVLPVYEWSIAEELGARCLVENVSGYMIQTNAHIQVENESQARAAVGAAFLLEITDIISFDYWCDTLDAHKVEAQKKALAEAKRKADLLLSAHFDMASSDKAPRPTNIHEKTEVVYPKSLYESFSNDYSQSLRRNYTRQSLPEIHAIRPKNTHYRGFFAETDCQDGRLPMHPEISVVSTISCYYAVPGSAESDKK